VRGRAGRYLTEDLLLTAEYGVWRRSALEDSTGTEEGVASEPGFDGPVDRYIGSGVVALNLYPRLAGFMLRAGLGWGRIYAEVESDGTTLGEYASGPLLLMGAAYEFSLDPDLSMVVGADAGRVETSEGISGNFLQYYAAFQVHLDRLLPRNWF
jgi:hypothetical protein